MKSIVYNVQIGGNFYDKEDIVNLQRLQKQLLLEENIFATLEECIDIWQGYSNNLSASWLFFPKKDEEILRYIKSDRHFISFENYTI